MGKMVLHIVVLPPFLVLTQHLWPGSCVRESVVGETALDREQGFRIILPGLASIDPLLANAEHVVEQYGLVAVKDASAIRDDSFWSTVAVNGICSFLTSLITESVATRGPFLALDFSSSPRTPSSASQDRSGYF